MRRLTLLAGLAATATMLGAGAPAFAARPAAGLPIAGLWRLANDNVVIRIGACGRAVCGNLVSADKLKANPRLKDKKNQDPAQRGRPVRGLLLLSGFAGGPVKWTGGKVYNPDDGHTYNSEMTLTDARTLKVEGCVLKPLCKTTALTRLR